MWAIKAKFLVRACIVDNRVRYCDKEDQGKKLLEESLRNFFACF